MEKDVHQPTKGILHIFIQEDKSSRLKEVFAFNKYIKHKAGSFDGEEFIQTRVVKLVTFCPVISLLSNWNTGNSI